MKQLKRSGWALRSWPLALVALGCGSSDVPARELADAESSIRAASEVGAENNPDAALHLKMARDRVDRARKLGDDGEGDAARRALQEAELDAELALLLARKEDAQQRARSAESRLGKQAEGDSGQAKETESKEQEQQPMEMQMPMHTPQGGQP